MNPKMQPASEPAPRARKPLFRARAADAGVKEIRTTILIQRSSKQIYLLEGRGRAARPEPIGPLPYREALHWIEDPTGGRRRVLAPSRSSRAVYIDCKPLTLEELRVLAEFASAPEGSTE
jgi:hypothetical protein